MRRFALLSRWMPCLLVLGLAGCVSPPPLGVYEQNPQFQPTAASDVFVQTSWDLARWTRPGGGLRSLPHSSANARPISMNFIHEQGQPRVYGEASCNRYDASYTVANGLLIVQSSIRATTQACAPDMMQLEQDFLQGLTRITASTLDNSVSPRQLTLVLSTGDVLDFARRVHPAAGTLAP